MMGYALAYEALGEHDEALRALIRDDVIELLDELMRIRSVSAVVTVDNVPIVLPVALQVRYSVMEPHYNDGFDDSVVHLTVDSNNLDKTTLSGIREFIPDLSVLLAQVPLLGWVASVPVPRADSAVMLSAAFRTGLLVTADLPAFSAKHQEIRRFYFQNDDDWGNVYDWVTLGKLSVPGSACGENYYGNNITMEPLYTWARLEDTPSLAREIQAELFGAVLWPRFRNHKNVFFSYIFAATVSPENMGPIDNPAAVLAIANTQLSQFPPPPRIVQQVDLRADPRYLPHSTECENQTDHANAIDVADRVMTGFLWQSHPWSLYATSPWPEPSWGMKILNGTDFMVAHWMGRHHAFLADEHPERCLVWRDGRFPP